MILLIDNYDSFVYNLSRYFQELGCSTRVVRNDALSAPDIRALSPDAIILSPGPCDPSRAGVSLEVVRRLDRSFPILGICLGHQAIAAAYGGRIARARPVHGRTSPIHHDGRGIFRGLPSPLRAARYHSLQVDPAGLPAELEVSASAEDCRVMALRHRTRPVVGIQFHPESVLTEHGHRLLAGFLDLFSIPRRSAERGALELAKGPATCSHPAI
ncbi:MAG: aminodeoxychorismate/anthranilate synthase component II [Planctomycetes bacterium]|nr:aminodeoxychorismate/anthranilate synthase component II [Planctomycetota bacterium]